MGRTSQPDITHTISKLHVTDGHIEWKVPDQLKVRLACKELIRAQHDDRSE